MARLNYMLASESEAKGNQTETVRLARDIFRKDELFKGIVKTYKHHQETTDELLPPNEQKPVQARAEDVLVKVSHAFSHLWDVVAMKEWANTRARADLVVDGVTLISNAPVLYLLWLQKQLTLLEEVLKQVPTYPTDEQWQYQPDQKLHASAPLVTIRTKKVPRFHVKAEGGPTWAPQVETRDEDVGVGTWQTIKFQGAVSPARKEELLARISKLKVADDIALAEANTLVIEEVYVAKHLFDYLLAP